MAEVFTGARAKFYINGQAVGYCAGVSGEEAIDYEPVETLDFLEVREHIPVAYRASLSAAFFRLVGSSLKSYQGRQNDLGGMQIFPQFDKILTSGVLEAAIHNTKTSSDTGEAVPDVMAMFTSVRAASKTFDVSARGVVTENCSFVAIRQKDESEV
jgi:hypothetical protein